MGGYGSGVSSMPYSSALAESYPQSAAPRQDGALGQALSELNGLVGELHGVINQHENRLGPVLAQEPPMNTSEAKGPATISQSLVHRVMDTQRSLRNALERLSSLTGRLEV